MSHSALMSAPWCWHKRLFMWPVNGVKERRLRGEGRGRAGEIRKWQRKRRKKHRERRRRRGIRRGKSKNKKERKKGRKKKNKQEIPHSWYHMPGPPFLMRQRSMYSLALSLTGGTPIMPKLTCSNKAPPQPTTTTHRTYHPPRSPAPSSASLWLPPPTIQRCPFAFLDQEPCLISQESHIDGVGQLSPAREKELGVRPRSASPSPPSLPPTLR